MFAILIEDRAIMEIANTIRYYENKHIGLGNKFINEISKNFDALSLNPYYQIRYKNVRCKPLKNFPFLIHYTVDKKKNEIKIYAIVNTHQNPNIVWVK